VAGDADAAVAAAAELGYPVAVKSLGGSPWQRGAMIAVRLDLTAEDAVRTAYDALRAATGTDEVYVQRMAPAGTACTIGLQDDPSFGTLVSFGLSGMVSLLLGDRGYRAVPVTDVDAAALVRSPRAAPVLTGYRGSDQVDLDALAGIVLRVSALAEDLPEVRSLVLQPVLASPGGAHVTGARVIVGPPPSRHDTGPRRLRDVTAIS
jgi:hypothetical protein